MLVVAGALYASAWLLGCEDSGGMDPAAYQAELEEDDAQVAADDAGVPACPLAASAEGACPLRASAEGACPLRASAEGEQLPVFIR